MGIAELTTLTVLVADSTKLAGWLTACCLACTLFHCGARALSMLVDKMRAPLQLGWSPSLLSRPGLVLFVGESQKEGQLSTNSIF
uniref:SJCHGC09823 protein n=1 Tax=Schistosoma japonicum TaxID=6182 RepID=Q5BQS8_SCHJA|nr:SJCHGC09823 protein [Schistosoma japonicum]